MHGVNALLAEGIPTLTDVAVPAGYRFTEIAGLPSLILWAVPARNARRISVWWDYHHARHPHAVMNDSYREQFAYSLPMARRSAYRQFVGTTVSGYLALTEKPHLLGYGSAGIVDTFRTPERRDTLAQLASVPAQGFRAEGPLFI